MTGFILIIVYNAIIGVIWTALTNTFKTLVPFVPMWIAASLSNILMEFQLNLSRCQWILILKPKCQIKLFYLSWRMMFHQGVVYLLSLRVVRHYLVVLRAVSCLSLTYLRAQAARVYLAPVLRVVSRR